MITTSSGQALSKYRWVICALLFVATTINYADRQIFSLLKLILDHDLGWSNEQFGWVNSLFQGAYAFSYLGFGWFIDKYGTKIGYSVSIISWSLAAAAHAIVNSIPGFGLARIALGLGEGGNFPAAIKTVAEWFPARERSYATTLFNSGANVGALLAPAVVPPLALAFSWHAPFLLAGVAGLIWFGFWWVLYRPSKHHGEEPAESAPPIPWRNLLMFRQTWAFVASMMLISPVWWFFLIWLPDYFKTSLNPVGFNIPKVTRL